MKKSIKKFITSAMIAGLAILGSSCGDSSGDFDNFSRADGGAGVVAEVMEDPAGRYSGQVALDDGRVIISSFKIDDSGKLDGYLTIEALDAGQNQPTVGEGIDSQSAAGVSHVLSGTYTLEGRVEEEGLAATGQILRNELETGLFFVDLTSGFTSFSFECMAEPVNGLYPCPSEEDIEYFLNHIRLGTHRH